MVGVFWPRGLYFLGLQAVDCCLLGYTHVCGFAARVSEGNGLSTVLLSRRARDRNRTSIHRIAG